MTFLFFFNYLTISSLVESNGMKGSFVTTAEVSSSQRSNGFSDTQAHSLPQSRRPDV